MKHRSCGVPRWPATASVACALACAMAPGQVVGQASSPVPAATSAWLPERVFLRHGVASDARATVLGAQWDVAWRRRWGNRGVFSAYLEAAVGHWKSRIGEVRGSAVSTQVGLTPVFRYSFGGEHGWYVEAGVGANVIAPVYRSREKQFSTAFNFGDHASVGWLSASPPGWDWSLRIQHFSNAGIARPNPGENFVQLQVAASLE
jgi:lipid A 3-O-deacylase